MIISTIVDKQVSNFDEDGVYKDLIISTIVDPQGTSYVDADSL